MTTTASPRRSFRTKLTATGAVAALAVAGVVWSQRAAPAAPSVAAAPTALVAPGLVEAQGERVALGFEAAGRIVELAVAEGEAVTAGQVLGRLDDRVAQARVARAEAGVAAAEARRQLAVRGARPDERRAADAEAAAAGATAHERALARGRADALYAANADAVALAEVDAVRGQAAAAEAAAAAGLVKGRPLLGSVNVRKYGELDAGGKPFWKISKSADEYLPVSAIRQHDPSRYQGVRLGDDTGLTLPLAIVWPRGDATTTWTHGAPRGGGSRRQLKERMAVPVLETAQDGGAVTAYRIGDGEWIDAAQVRVAMPMPLPAGVKPGERWIDIDLDQQLLVAYEGDLPVYATLVSTGLKDTPTETGIYRIWKKVSETDMKGLTGEDPYSVATVPWTQFFSPEKGLALHTSYWHDRFGFQKSHGCVNLAPRDARWLYFFTDPQVPPGWSMAAGVVEAPGSVVRVRSKADPNPPVRGYAQKVDDTDR